MTENKAKKNQSRFAPVKINIFNSTNQFLSSYSTYRHERGPKSRRRRLVKLKGGDEEFEIVEVDNSSDDEMKPTQLTDEETNYLKNLLALDIECNAKYPNPINAHAMQEIPVDLILEWNKTSLERLSYFAFKVHLFQR